MLIHIVKTGETVDKITNSYRILKSELISNNLHITDFSNLKSGMKLKIPLLSKDNIETLEETEAFIDDYYPSFEKFLNNEECVESSDGNSCVLEEPIVIQHDVVEVIKDVKIEEEVRIQTEDKIEKPLNNNVYQYKQNPYYSGNVIPSYNQKFIRKI